jgi:putative membrane protein
MMYWHGGHLSGWGWALMSVGMITFWVVLITGIVLLIRCLASGGERMPRRRPHPVHSRSWPIG